jgi:hypothetical protein
MRPHVLGHTRRRPPRDAALGRPYDDMTFGSGARSARAVTLRAITEDDSGRMTRGRWFATGEPVTRAPRGPRCGSRGIPKIRCEYPAHSERHAPWRQSRQTRA